MLGPFAVAKGNLDQFPELGLNVELELPPSLAQVHPVFHVEKVEPFVGSSKDQFPGRTQQAPAPWDVGSGSGSHPGPSLPPSAAAILGQVCGVFSQ
jgi:hypothetical protein